jgi:hypothetical protein
MELDWDLSRQSEPLPEWADKELARCRMWLSNRQFIPL